MNGNMKYLKTALILSLAGTLFAGYLSATKLFSKSCAFGETCPLFIGYPACYYGLAFFFSILVSTIVALVRKDEGLAPVKRNVAISALGTVFAGGFVIQEVWAWFTYGFRWYTLGFSTCMYGFVFFVAVLIVSVRRLKS